MEANTKICVYFTKSYGPALDPPPPNLWFAQLILAFWAIRHFGRTEKFVRRGQYEEKVIFINKKYHEGD